MELVNYKHLLSRIGTTCKHHKEISRLSGADFNVFKIVKVISDEVRHSAFLAELLNPKGSHGQEEVFLRLFVEKLGIKDFQCQTAVANVEQHIGAVTDTNGGRIDILIDDKNGNHIIIENKIYANDGDNQLIRYHNFNKQNLFYLTLNGCDATDKSTLNNSSGVKLECSKDYKLLSYKTDIVEWLEQCQKEAVSMPLLREGIAHYINLIKYLTGDSINKAMQQEIINLLTESPTNLANAREIAENYSHAKLKLFWEFWKTLKEALNCSNIIIEDNERTATKERASNFFRKKDRFFGFWSQIYENKEITIHWGCEIDDDIYFGFTIENMKKGGISNHPEYAPYRSIILECDPNYRQSEYWLGFQEPKPNLNFRQFNSDEIFNLANRKVLELNVQQIADKAKNDILFVQKRLDELYRPTNQ